ncbi:MAG: hypothetical protein NTW82_10270 [Bacteroidia bacterium]|nr:hypothetical protein [Bacteroidia bacterium]
MVSKRTNKFILSLAFSIASIGIFAQGNVPLGIHYQAVARDNFGNELVNKKISVKFSVISGNPLGTIVYQELHQDIFTSKFGVFSLIIGHGVPTGGTQCGELSQISWESANHYLKVEVKFENDFMDMGTMQFLAVPYALYAGKSLEPGPAGPQGEQGLKGEPGDPASDDQTLSFDGSTISIADGNSLSLTDLLQNLTVSYQNDGTYLGISRGNSVKLATIEADGDPRNELQDLTISSDMMKITNNSLATEWDLSPYRQSLSWDPVTRVLNISGISTPINLSELKNDDDSDITNEIQDISLAGDLLTITRNESSSGVSLSKYLDDTDKQQMEFSTSDNILSLTNSTSVDLTSLKNDADYDITNEIQDIQLTGDLLTITKNSGSTGVSMSKYLDNTDNQQLSFSGDYKLSLTNSVTVDLSSLADADADPANEIQDLQLVGNKLSITRKTGAYELNMADYLDDTDDQTLEFVESDLTESVTISEGNSVVIDNKVAFRAKKTTSETVSVWKTDYDFIMEAPEYNEGEGFDYTTGEFTAPFIGVYVFDISYTATEGVDGGDSRILKIQYKHGLITEYEILNSHIDNGVSIIRSITLKLNIGDKIKPIINVGNGYQTGTGSFSGFKVN